MAIFNGIINRYFLSFNENSFWSNKSCFAIIRTRDQTVKHFNQKLECDRNQVISKLFERQRYGFICWNCVQNSLKHSLLEYSLFFWCFFSLSRSFASFLYASFLFSITVESDDWLRITSCLANPYFFSLLSSRPIDKKV